MVAPSFHLRGALAVAATAACWLGGSSAYAAPSAACQRGPSRAAAFDHYTLTRQTITANRVRRTYQLALPDNLEAGKPVALVFGWHSLSARAIDARSMLDLERYARGRAIFVYPEAVYAPEQDTVRWDLTVDGNSPSLGRGNDIALFDAIVTSLGSRFCLDTAQIFSAGFSAGGFMTHTLACYRGSALRAVGIVAGKLEVPPEFDKTACTDVPVAAWIAHGTGDAVVPVAAGRASRDHWLALAQCGATSSAVSPSPCRAYVGCAPLRPIVWCEHRESEASNPHLVPTFAPSAMWSFFAHFLSAPATPTGPGASPASRPGATPASTTSAPTGLPGAVRPSFRAPASASRCPGFLAQAPAAAPLSRHAAAESSLSPPPRGALVERCVTNLAGRPCRTTRSRS